MGKKTPTLEGHITGQSNEPISKPAHALSFIQVIEETKCNPDDGLTTSEAKTRHEKFGNNDLGDDEGVKPGKILLRQIANAMTLVLILAMGVSFGIKSWIEGGVVTAIIILNIVVGFMQEFNAEKTMDSLRGLSSPTATAIRDGKTVTIPTVEIVVGDLVELKTGDTVPADIRLVEAVNFETDEALLTGESLPVLKDGDAVFNDDTGPGDRLNVAFSSSTVTKGRARGVVFATGMYTEIGSIAMSLRQKGSRRRPVKRKADGSAKPHRYAEAWGLTAADAVGHFLGVNVGTPLQKKLARLALLLFGIAVVCAIIVLAANNFSNNQEVIIYAVATGLSMVPASLIVVLTITMAAGTKRMVERHVIVRSLKSLEALGGVTDICSDKTGTLTQGKMVAKKAWIPAKGTYSVGVTTEPFNPTVGSLSFTTKPPRHIDPDMEEKPQPSDELLADNPHLLDYLKIASLANLANVHKTNEGVWNARGDPTEIAIQIFASRFGWNRLPYTTGESPAWKQLAEFPFDSDVKKMSVIFEDIANNKKHVFTKGAVERVIYSCSTVFNGESESAVEMDDDYREEILANMEALASLGLRVLALASKEFTDALPAKGEEVDRSRIESNLVFRGLVGLYDPPRPETAGAVRQCQKAGIEVHMLTGDHPGTARAIAAEVGILPSNMSTLAKEVTDAMVMTASQFDRLSEDQIDALPLLPLVIARCAPNTKVRMIDALHRRKAFAAMTGDGVNDSPSLKRSDVGIGMGTGSDVAKDASDIVLTDDNFASILNAIEEGRRMFDNIQKFILHLLAQNVAQACVLLIGLAFKDESGLSVFPITPVEVMWIIMVTSSLPDMGLGFEIAAPDILDRPPQSLKRGVFTTEVLLDMVVYGLWIAALCLASFVLVMYGWGDGNLGRNCNDTYSDSCDTVFRARATAFACLTWFSLFLAWQMLDMRRSFFAMQPGSTKYFTQWMIDVWRNKFLFYSIMAGFVTIFPVLYIPVINQVVFKHKGISWEWGIVFVATILFFLGVESWKFAKRTYFKMQEKKTGGGRRGSIDLESRVFERYLSTAISSDGDHDEKK
ncbi:potassium/sodium eff [Dothidotthia symphoricarpi CBS 119687]|uniref:P-type Na(+) transporter n=1 Tax=Dothidotthia symphoricarpi CBS 119687 TaxID=1392245 RepID=A0A6A5ZYL4_9PLEO|nr:potassium/sodium eff [Dothidotthia symphoricarpi CBS 119687]KAF2123411.1 potassium/sodium eff [Dothidotthia symphoricarpi CBS 119687]